MTTKFTHVKRYKRPTGHSCQHCKSRATTFAKRHRAGFVLDLWFCDEHAKARGATT